MLANSIREAVVQPHLRWGLNLLKYTEKMHVSVFTGRKREQSPSALGRKEKVEAGCCQGWDSCAWYLYLYFPLKIKYIATAMKRTVLISQTRSLSRHWAGHSGLGDLVLTDSSGV